MNSYYSTRLQGIRGGCDQTAPKSNLHSSPICCALCINTGKQCSNIAIQPFEFPRYCTLHYHRCELNINNDRWESYGIDIDKYDWILHRYYYDVYVKYKPRNIKNDPKKNDYENMVILEDRGYCPFHTNRKILWCNLFPKFLKVTKTSSGVYDDDELNQWIKEVIENILSLICKTDRNSDLEKSLLNPDDIILIGLVFYRMYIEIMFNIRLCMCKNDYTPQNIKYYNIYKFLEYINTIFYAMGMTNMVNPNSISNEAAVHILIDVDRALEILIHNKSKDTENWEYEDEDKKFNSESDQDVILDRKISYMRHNIEITIKSVIINK
jgi:hypothetical protein